MGSSTTMLDVQGNRVEIPLEVHMYQEAQQNNMTLTQHLNQKFPTAHGVGTAMEQLSASSGLYLRSDTALGINSPSLHQVLSGTGPMMGGEILRGSGGNSTPASRLLFPEVTMRAMESELSSSDTPFLKAMDQMVAITTNVPSARVDQPVISSKEAENSTHQTRAQLALPASMVSITVSDKSFKIPTYSIGLEISDEAKQAATLDLVVLALTANARGQSIGRAEQDLTAMIAGDADTGETAIAGVNASSFDSSINAGNPITQKAWMHFQRADHKKRENDWLLMTLNTALLLENRTGKPTSNNDDPNSPRIDSLFTLENLGVSQPKILLVPAGVVPENVIVGLDSKFAMRKTVNVNASYSAIEEFVLRRSTVMMFEFGYSINKLYHDAWNSMTIGQ